MDAVYEIGVDVPRDEKERRELLASFYDDVFNSFVKNICKLTSEKHERFLLSNYNTIKNQCMRVLSERGDTYGSVFDDANVFSIMLSTFGYESADENMEFIYEVFQYLHKLKISRLLMELRLQPVESHVSVIAESDSTIDAINYCILYNYYLSDVGRKLLASSVPKLRDRELETV